MASVVAYIVSVVVFMVSVVVYIADVVVYIADIVLYNSGVVWVRRDKSRLYCIWDLVVYLAGCMLL